MKKRAVKLGEDACTTSVPRDENDVEQTTSTLGSPLRGTLGEAHGSY